MNTLGIVVVDYKSASRTIAFIENELSKIEIPYKVVVVINSASEESIAQYKDKGFVDISSTVEIKLDNNYFISPQTENLGFAKANNIGADFLLKNFGCKYLLFSNNDIELPRTATVETLIDTLQSDMSIGMIGPKVIGLDGKCQSPESYKSISDRYVWMYLLTPFLSKENKIKRFKLDYSEKATEGYHYRIMGSFFMMPSSCFVDCGGFDPNTFLYGEEMILSERLHKIGKRVYYQPTVTVVHAHGATIGKHLKSTKISAVQAKSEKYYYTRYRGVSHLKANMCIWIFKIISFVRNYYQRQK